MSIVTVPPVDTSKDATEQKPALMSGSVSLRVDMAVTWTVPPGRPTVGMMTRARPFAGQDSIVPPCERYCHLGLPQLLVGLQSCA